MYTLGIYFFFLRNNYFKTPIEILNKIGGSFHGLAPTLYLNTFKDFTKNATQMNHLLD